MPKMPVYLKKRDMIQLNQVEEYQDSCEGAWLEDAKMADSQGLRCLHIKQSAG